VIVFSLQPEDAPAPTDNSSSSSGSSSSSNSNSSTDKARSSLMIDDDDEYIMMPPLPSELSRSDYALKQAAIEEEQNLLLETLQGKGSSRDLLAAEMGSDDSAAAAAGKSGVVKTKKYSFDLVGCAPADIDTHCAA
jgi:hypothetical protein